MSDLLRVGGLPFNNGSRGKILNSRLVPYFSSSRGEQIPLGTAPWSGQWTLITTNSGTSVKNNGHGGSAATGTISHVAATTTNGYLANFVSAASLSATATLQTTGNLVFIGSSSNYHAGFDAHATALLPDASYNNSGATTGSRIWGLVLAASVTNAFTSSRGGTQDLIGFAREHDGTSSDTNWQLVTCNNTTTTVTDTGVAFTTSKLMQFHLFCAAGDTSVYWQIDNLTDRTPNVASGVVTATLPRSTIGLTTGAGLLTIDATARNYRMSSLYIASDQG